MKYKLAIFDMDGTILNTIDDLADAGNYICNLHGYKTHSLEEYKYFVGNGIPKLVQRFLPPEVSKEEYDCCLKEYIEYYGKNAANKTCPYDGIEKLLKNLHASGMLLAVNSNKVESAVIKLCTDYFPGMFDFVAGGNIGNPSKPSPNGVFSILEKAGISRKEAETQAVYIGDSDVDILTGKNAGISVIGVDWGFRGKAFLKEHGADKIVENADELYKMLTL